MKVSIKRDVLLATIKENYEKHRKIVEEAQKKYRELAIEELERILDDARNGRSFSRSLALAVPMDQSRDYRKAIRQLELCTNQDIDMSEVEFDQLIMDNWVWKAQFASINSCYAAMPEDFDGERD